MRIWLHVLAGNIRGVVIATMGFGAFCILVLLAVVPLDSPVLRREDAVGQVVAFRVDPINPRNIVGRGRSIEYSVRLRDGAGYVVVRGRASQPHALGAEIVLTRTIRDNGVVSYTFKETPWMQVGY